MSKRRPSSPTNSTSLSCFPYGVGHSDEGVCLLLQIGPHRILLDCGITDLYSLQVDNNPPAELVFCSHAHADHSRGLQLLHKSFPQMPIYASEVTAKLLQLHWQELKTSKSDSICQTLPWQSPVTLAENLQAELFPAGHLPGAAAIVLTYRTKHKSYKVMYTGDFSVSNFQLVEGLSIENFRGLAPDVLIIEGTYGTVRHPHRRHQEKHLMERINQALISGKNVFLPVPPIGLGQEILKLLRSHHQFTGRDLDIWVDGITAQACDLYLELLNQFPASVQNFAKHQSLFWDERVCPRMRKLVKPDSLRSGKLPCILLVDYTADLLEYLAPEGGDWLILLPEHPLREIPPNKEQFRQISTLQNIEIDTYLLAEHSDGRNTTQLIHNLRPQHIIFVHGSPNYLVELTGLEELRNRYQLHAPSNNTLVELPIGDRFIQPATPPPNNYEGELNEVGSYVTITLPDVINSDPRWNKFADTGLVEARWQGDELILRGLSQKELLNQNSEGKISTDIDCCNACKYYSNQRCWNQSSPLYGFKVIPEGYCPVFEPLESDKQ
ncbi:MAG: MBL fold metallo-hydrolase [Xenococcaceae cyanobacterium MO_188.B32]|nr:MBL fold metallo-hydrolase [Xenococcaceae cyanobacterium MO_188.B32]